MRRTSRWLAIAGLLLATAGLVFPLVKRSALGLVVAGCALNQRVTGAPFPCLATGAGGAWGYAVLRPLSARTEALVVATAPIEGIESPALLQPAASALWQAAWAARGFVAAALGHDLPRTAIGLAVNSRPSRTQDRLHIHVDCAEAGYQNALADRQDEITEQWTILPVLLEGRHYWVRRVEGETLAGINPVALLTDGLPQARADMTSMTIAVFGARFKNGRDGFYLLADRADLPRGDGASAEELLNHYCPGR